MASAATGRAPGAGFGQRLRSWRKHRGLSQLGLSLEAGVSPRHLSFLETGRASPSQRMVLRLLDTLDVPLWDRNRMMLAAGYAPIHGESGLDDERLRQVRRVVDLLLERQQPYPAYAIDGAWNVVAANRPYRRFLETVNDPGGEARNVLRLLCAPHLLRPRVVNWRQVTQAVLRRVRRQLDAPEAPPALAAVVEEIRGYPEVASLLRTAAAPARGEPFVPLAVRTGDATVRWITTLLTVGGALDVAVDELVVECFFPADEESERLAVVG